MEFRAPPGFGRCALNIAEHCDAAGFQSRRTEAQSIVMHGVTVPKNSGAGSEGGAAAAASAAGQAPEPAPGPGAQPYSSTAGAGTEHD